jgi:hypothetical protein
MSTAEILIEETTGTCEVCIAVMNSGDDQPDTAPTACPECHVDLPE